MDLSSLQPILNLLTNQNNFKNFNQNFSQNQTNTTTNKNENQINIFSCYPSCNIDGSSILNTNKQNDTSYLKNSNTPTPPIQNNLTNLNNNPLENNSNNTTNPLPQTPNSAPTYQNFLPSQEGLLNLLATLAPNITGNGANPLLGIMQNFLKPKKEKEKVATTSSSTLKNETKIEDLKNVNDVDIE